MGNEQPADGDLPPVALRNELVPVDDAVLAACLGASMPAFLALRGRMEAVGNSVSWRWYRDGSAWLGRVERGAKLLAWLAARDGLFSVTVYAPASRVGELAAAGLSSAALARIEAARNIGATRPCVFPVRGADDLADPLAAIAWKRGGRRAGA